MKTKRLKANLIKSFFEPIGFATLAFLILLLAVLYSQNIDAAKIGIAQHVRGINIIAIELVVISLGYVIYVILGPIISLKRALWNNKNLDLDPIVIYSSHLVIHNNKKEIQVQLKDIKTISPNEKEHSIHIKYNDQDITIRNVDDVEKVSMYLETLISNKEDKEN